MVRRNLTEQEMLRRLLQIIRMILQMTKILIRLVSRLYF